MKNLTVKEVVYSLNRKNACHVSESEKSIRVASNQGDLGSKSWGKIDFLVNYCGFRIIKEYKR